MSPSSSALRGRFRRWVAAGAVLFAVTAAGIPVASAASAHVSTKSSSTAKASGSKAGSGSKAKTGSKTAVSPHDALPDEPYLNGAFVPVAPDRVLDTRSGVGTGGVVAKVGQNPLLLNVSGVTGNASVVPTAVVLNVTVIAPTKNTFVEVYPNGDGPTGTSNLNVVAGQVVANQVTVPVGQDGMVDLYNADGQTDLVADLAGYYTLDKAGSTYVPDGPNLVLDTRKGTGGVTGPIGAGQSASLQIAGVDGVPAGVTAVVLNVTATEGTANSYLTVYPDGASVPTASSLNFTAGHNVPNLVTVQVGADGKVDFANNKGDVQILADLAGYFVADSPQTGGVLDSTGPTRILDTRNGTGAAKAPVGAGQSIALQVAGVGQVPSAGVTAVVLNVTAVSATKSSYLTVYPDGASVPTASNLNFSANQTVPNLVVVPVGADGKVDFYNNQGSVEVIADIFGYYEAGAKLSLPAMSWGSSSVDASAGGVTNTLTFTVADSDPAATQASGELEIRQRGTGADTYVGQPYYIGFNPQVTNSNGYATLVSGDTASSTYSYVFPVPEYSGSTSATWAVNLVASSDSPGNQQSVYAGSELDGLGDSFTATEQVPTVVPSYDSFTTTNSTGDLYDGVDAGAEYSLDVQDWQSGFSNGTITVTGPGGRTITADTEQYYDGMQQETSPCQGVNGTIANQVTCSFLVYFPADEPSGTWSVTSVSLTNNAGQTKDYTGLDLAPITLTNDSTIKGSNFKVSTTEVNNWSSTAPFTVSMNAGGAQDGVASIQLYLDTNGAGSWCSQQSTTPTVNADGSLSVTVTMDELVQGSTTCTIDGVAITDGAGDVSLYGDYFTPTSLGLTVTSTPDTTPPVATSAVLSVTSLPQSEISSEGDTVYLTVDTKKLTAPINGSSSTLYNSSGTAVGEEGGGASVNAGGQLTIGLDIPNGLAVGTYTVGFSLTDKGNLTTQYGMPGSAAVPGGTLKFTITSG
jgi:hypothetical protein